MPINTSGNTAPLSTPGLPTPWPVLKQSFLPADLQPQLESLGFDGCIAVQARQDLEETAWLLQLAEQNPFIKAVVGWVDLCSDDVPRQLENFSQNRKFAGVRHVLQDEPDDRFMLRPEFRRGIARLREFNLTYDLLLFPRHLPFASELVAEFPHQPFVLDHLAKPDIAAGQVLPWREDLQTLAKLPNVCCKLSGLVTEAKWKLYTAPDFNRYLEVALGAFGWSRLMIGSDWPVCKLSAEYAPTMKLVMDYVGRLPEEAQAAILGNNAAGFYNLRRG